VRTGLSLTPVRLKHRISRPLPQSAHHLLFQAAYIFRRVSGIAFGSPTPLANVELTSVAAMRNRNMKPASLAAYLCELKAVAPRSRLAAAGPDHPEDAVEMSR
jgi:hypothetical protein